SRQGAVDLFRGPDQVPVDLVDDEVERLVQALFRVGEERRQLLNLSFRIQNASGGARLTEQDPPSLVVQCAADSGQIEMLVAAKRHEMSGNAEISEVERVVEPARRQDHDLVLRSEQRAKD